ncbi:MAG: hypothetical protein E7350_04915 [Clostridiales bacterium]|nr:hypothetical protein [Clostridiales bacterium]
MKKMLYIILISALLFSLVSCDKSYLCSLEVLCSNENMSIIVDGEASNSIEFSSYEFNRQPSEYYSRIDFTSNENGSEAKMHKFEIACLADDTCTLSLKLVDANKYVVDFLRVGIIVEGELRVYKYYDESETIYHKENDPESILHFNSESEIFNGLTVDLSAGETTEIVIFIWIEEAEQYDNNGEHYKGWAVKSYEASPIVLSMEVR